MLGIPNLNTVYEDDTIAVLIHDIAGEGKLLVCHAEVVPKASKELFLHYMEVMDELFASLKAKGVEEIEAWVNTDEEMKYAQFFGFDEFVGELTVNGQTCIPSVFRLKKDLTKWVQ